MCILECTAYKIINFKKHCKEICVTDTILSKRLTFISKQPKQKLLQ